MKLPEPKQSDFEIVPSGTHAARCYRFLDLGTQITEFKGEKKPAHQVMISWELPNELMKDGRPFTVHKTYTWSMSEKANLRKALESWRGKKFEETDFGPNGFDTKKLIGATCMIGVSHSQSNGKTYANISSISPMMKGLTIPETVNEPVYFTLEDYSPTIFAGLSQNIQEKIKRSPEFLKATGASDEHETNQPDDFGDEIPF